MFSSVLIDYEMHTVKIYRSVGKLVILKDFILPRDYQAVKLCISLKNNCYKFFMLIICTLLQSPSEPLPPPATSSGRASEKAWLVLKWYNVDAK